MDNSLKKKRNHRKRGLTPPAKGETKTFLIGKELKTKDLRQTAAERGSAAGSRKSSYPPFPS